jgi:hypothetical protein
MDAAKPSCDVTSHASATHHLRRLFPTYVKRRAKARDELLLVYMHGGGRAGGSWQRLSFAAACCACGEHVRGRGVMAEAGKAIRPAESARAGTLLTIFPMQRMRIVIVVLNL